MDLLFHLMQKMITII